jgi:hypothetical protein
LPEDLLPPTESSHTLLADFPPVPPALSLSDDHVDDTQTSMMNEPVSVPTFRYPTLDLDPTASDAFQPSTPDTTTLPRRPSMTRRATSSFIRASARASTVAATPLVHAFWFVLSFLAATAVEESGNGQEGSVGTEADAGLGDVLGTSERRRRRYTERHGQRNTTDIHETGTTHDDTSERADEDEEEVDRELVLPGGWNGNVSSR